MTSNRWRRILWGFSLVLISILAICWGQLDRIQEGGFLRIAYHLAIWVAMGIMVFAFPKLTRKQGVLLILLGSFVVRLAFWQAPVSDDVNRYLWEGSLIWKGENPYATVVDDERWIDHRDEYWKDVNHRDRLTAYPPGVELIMAAASWLWYDLWVFKIVALVGDFWVLGILIFLFREFGQDIRWLGLYAFNPLVLASFAAEAHFDSLMVGAMLTALLMAHRKQNAWAWFWLGVAVQMKIIVIVLLPYFLVRADWKKSLPFIAVLILPSLFFGEHFAQALVGLFGFGKDGAFNGGLYESLRLVGFSDFTARHFGLLVFVSVGLFFGWRTLKGKELHLHRVAMVVMSTLVICSPVVHFWYLTWIIPFVALRPSLSWIVLCGTMSIYFMAWEGLTTEFGWGYHRAWVVASWAPFFVVLIWESRFLRTRFQAKSDPAPQTLDLVVPVLNGGDELEGFLKDLREKSPEAEQIIVVDGGSSDRSVFVAQDQGCHVIKSERGRGEQIAAGIRASQADLIAIIHADTQPEEGWISRLFRVVHTHDDCPAFALGQRFAPGNLRLLLVEFLNEARVLFGGSVFGDQTLIVRREALSRIGGFPDQPLMEDVEVSWRLLSQGRICYLGQEWKVSSQKWRGNFVPRFKQVISLMVRYRWIRMRSVDAAGEFSRKLYREYYRS